MNPYSQLLETIKNEKDFIDLTNTNFTTLTPLLNFNKLQADLKSYLNNRKYEPDPKGLLSARNAISKYYKDKGFSIDPNNIIITASTSESYALIFSSLLKYEDRVLLPNPSYPLFSYLASYTRIKPLFYNLKEKAGRWRVDLESLKRNSGSSNALVLISPNNPTGMMLCKEDIKKILDLIKGKDILVILDEVFCDYIYAGNDHRELLESIVKSNKVIILNGISKSLASPDLKLAWMAIPNYDQDLIDTLETANDTYLNCSYLTQALLPKLFKISNEKRAKWLEQLNRNRNLFITKNSKRVSLIPPQGGIHCVIDFPALAWENERIALKLLEEYHLAVHPGYFYDFPASSNKVIVSLIQDPEKFEIALSRLVEFSIQYS